MHIKHKQEIRASFFQLIKIVGMGGGVINASSASDGNKIVLRCYLQFV